MRRGSRLAVVDRVGRRTRRSTTSSCSQAARGGSPCASRPTSRAESLIEVDGEQWTVADVRAGRRLRRSSSASTPTDRSHDRRPRSVKCSPEAVPHRSASREAEGPGPVKPRQPATTQGADGARCHSRGDVERGGQGEHHRENIVHRPSGRATGADRRRRDRDELPDDGHGARASRPRNGCSRRPSASSSCTAPSSRPAPTSSSPARSAPRRCGSPRARSSGRSARSTSAPPSWRAKARAPTGSSRARSARPAC